MNVKTFFTLAALVRKQQHEDALACAREVVPVYLIPSV